MKQKFKMIRKKLVIGLPCGALFCVAVIMIWRSFTYSYDDMQRCTTIIEFHSFYSISMDGKPILYFSRLNADSTLEGITTSADSARNNIIYSAGFWVNKMPVIPSCYGHLATAFPGKNDDVQFNHTDVLHIVTIETDRLKYDKDSLKSEAGELKYYLSVHNVKDEGYNMIAKYAAKINSEIKVVDSILSIITRYNDLSKLSVKHISEYSAIYYDQNNKLKRVRCKQTANDKQCYLLQTVNRQTPDGVCAIFMKPWTCITPKNIILVSYPGLNNKVFASPSAKAEIIAGKYSLKKGHDITSILVANGSPVFSHRGRLIGITSGKDIINRKYLTNLFDKER